MYFILYYIISLFLPHFYPYYYYYYLQLPPHYYLILPHVVVVVVVVVVVMTRAVCDASSSRAPRDSASRKQGKADITKAIGFFLASTFIPYASLLRFHVTCERRGGLRDGKVLTENIDGLPSKTKSTTFAFILSDCKKLVDGAFKEFLAFEELGRYNNFKDEWFAHRSKNRTRGSRSFKVPWQRLEAAQDFGFKRKQVSIMRTNILMATCSSSPNFSVNPKKHPGMWKL